jgi:hypothetical protein
MTKIVDYQIVHVTHPSYLPSDVNRLLADGYQPYGFPFFEPTGRGIVQALVKYDDSGVSSADVL